MHSWWKRCVQFFWMQCSECGKSFLLEAYLLGHVQRRHPHMAIAMATTQSAQANTRIEWGKSTLYWNFNHFIFEKRQGDQNFIYCGKARSPVLPNEKRSAWTCWGSGVKSSHRSTSCRWRWYMTALTHYERQRWKKINFFAKKPLPRSFVSTRPNAVHVRAQFHWLAYTRNSRPCDVVCSKSQHFRSIALAAWSHHT